MFIRVSENVISKEHIVALSKHKITMVNGQEIAISKEDYEMLEKRLLPKKRETKKDEPKGERTELFKKLNKLIGGSDRIVFTEKLQGHLNARIKEGFTEELLVLAAKNLSKDGFYTGKNSKGWKASIEWFLKDQDHINRFLNTQTQTKPRLFND